MNQKSNKSREMKEAVASRTNAEKSSAVAVKTGNVTEAVLADFFIKNNSLYRKKRVKEGKVDILLSNFAPCIISKTIIDEGQCIESEKPQVLAIAAIRADGAKLCEIYVPVSEFASMNWLGPWRPHAFISSGSSVKDQVRLYMEASSGRCVENTVYAHTGWKMIKGQYVFLHGAGAVGVVPEMNIEMQLAEDISRYILPVPPLSSNQEEARKFSEKEKRGLEASLAFLELGKKEAIIPLWTSVWLAPLISLLDQPPNFSYFVAGASRTFKTSVVLLMLSHFGNFKSQKNMANFTYTAARLEKYSFLAKDVPALLDDWSPSTNKRAAEKKESIVDTIIRSYANRSSRGRMNANMTQQASLPPRGLLIITSELLPSIESIITRIVTLEFNRETIDREKLTRMQTQSDVLPYAMHAYLTFVRDNISDIQTSFRERFAPIRSKAITQGCDPRIAEHIAFQVFALETAMTFFVHRQVINDEAAASLIAVAWDIFLRLAASQESHVKDDDPVELFFEILQTLLIQDQARLEPYHDYTGERVGKGGEQIGWLDSEAIYLMPAAAWGAVHMYYRKANSHFPITSKQAFFSMLRNRKIVQPGGDGKTTLKAMIQGRQLRILKIIDPAFVKKLSGEV